MKQCSKCKEYKELSAFSRTKSNLDGYMYYCKPCYSAYMKAWRKNGGKEKIHYWLHNTEKGQNTKDKIHKKYRESGERATKTRERKLKKRVVGLFSKDEFNALKECYSNTCLCCGTLDNITADHVIPLSKDGLNTIDNIQPLCMMCNAIKNAKHIDFRLFWILYCM